jgi:DNA-binding CsgD family transcriptional regulator
LAQPPFRGATPLSGTTSNPAIHLNNAAAWLEVARRLGLSAQELNVAKRILAGEKLATIAFELNLGLGTVKTYSQRIYHKLQVSDHCRLAVVMLSNYFDAISCVFPPHAPEQHSAHSPGRAFKPVTGQPSAPATA